MAHHTHVPQGATLAKESKGFISEGEHKGEPVTLRLYTGYASDGYKTNYTRRPAAWLEVIRPKFHWNKRYTGKRYEQAEVKYTEALPYIVSERPTQ